MSRLLDLRADRIACEIAAHGPLTTDELADYLGWSLPTVEAVVEHLAVDGRATIVSLDQWETAA